VQVIHLEDALAGISGLSKLGRMLLVILLPGWFLDRVVLRCQRFRWDDLLTIVFSSGSTGDPKGVMLSLRTISSNADSFQKGVNFTTDDRMLCTLPFFHSFGYTVCLWAPVSIGMSSVYYPDPRAAKEVGELCERWKCTIALGTATFVRFYLRRCEPTHFRSTRLFICGAEKLPVPLQLEFQAKFGTLLLEGYGCTEVSPVVGTNLPDLTVRGVHQVANVQGTIGQSLPGVATKAFDDQTHQPLPVGVEGVLCVKGPNVMVGYLHQPEKTKQVMIGEWYVTGDVGHIEPNGFIRITGRLSRFAKIAGEMVPLERLEEEIHSVLGLSGDRAVAVAAVPDAKRGERLVVLHLKEFGARLKEAFDKLRTRGLPNLWVPDVRDCYPVEAFPALGSGKLDLRGLSELAKRLAPTA
jgi:acyl-[acyl-carrier-protein]-phospholipid O-acyltransferase/long-chain-fatty-acid--[acyl-carrier-protein] ligase